MTFSKTTTSSATQTRATAKTSAVNIRGRKTVLTWQRYDGKSRDLSPAVVVSFSVNYERCLSDCVLFRQYWFCIQGMAEGEFFEPQQCHKCESHKALPNTTASEILLELVKDLVTAVTDYSYTVSQTTATSTRVTRSLATVKWFSLFYSSDISIHKPFSDDSCRYNHHR